MVIVPARQAGNRFMGSLKGLQIRALYKCLLWEGGRGGGGRREGRWATVYKSGRKYQHERLYLQPIKLTLLNRSKDVILGFVSL
jgi:hypothetical protein